MQTCGDSDTGSRGSGGGQRAEEGEKTKLSACSLCLSDHKIVPRPNTAPHQQQTLQLSLENYKSNAGLSNNSCRLTLEHQYRQLKFSIGPKPNVDPWIKSK